MKLQNIWKRKTFKNFWLFFPLLLHGDVLHSEILAGNYQRPFFRFPNVFPSGAPGSTFSRCPLSLGDNHINWSLVPGGLNRFFSWRNHLFPFSSEGVAASEMSGSAVMGNVRESEMGFSFSSVLNPWVVEKSASASHLPPNLKKQLLFGYHFKNGKLKFCATKPFSHLAAKRKHGTMQIAFWTGFNLFHYICSKIRNNNFLGWAPSVFCS